MEIPLRKISKKQGYSFQDSDDDQLGVLLAQNILLL